MKRRVMAALLCAAVLVSVTACSCSEDTQGENGQPTVYTQDPNDRPIPEPENPVAQTHNNIGLTDEYLLEMIEDGEIPYDITNLSLRDNELTDLTPLAQFRYLETLNISENQIVDLKPLSELKNLKRLIISGNQIVDLTPLSALDGLMVLELQNNEIKDVTPLKDMKLLIRLNLYNNDIDEETLKELDASMPTTTVLW
ncbi:MAG: leucine-rich repeat domain-containing protein [Oscillospiraceae bacterium]|nr:leucine-rich repeat domain-containing protein [Oscillospiraceae bacterium]